MDQVKNDNVLKDQKERMVTVRIKSRIITAYDITDVKKPVILPQIEIDVNTIPKISENLALDHVKKLYPEKDIAIIKIENIDKSYKIPYNYVIQNGIEIKGDKI